MSHEHGEGGGDGDGQAPARRLDCAVAATMASIRTPLTREGSLILAIEAVTAAFGGGGGGDPFDGDLRRPLSREESLLRAVEVVTARSGDGGGGSGGDDDADFEKAAAELIASVGLVHVDAGDGDDEAFCGVVAGGAESGIGGDVVVSAW